MGSKDTMIKDFRLAPAVTKPRSSFSMNKRHLTTCDSGYLIPIYKKRMYPGDTISLSARHMTRLLSPMRYPVLDNIKVEMHYFFCDMRVVWEDFSQFMGERLDPDVAPNISMPQMTIHVPAVGGYAVLTHTPLDYLGIPPLYRALPADPVPGIGDAGLSIDCTPLRVYNQIYNWYYRSESVTDMAPVYTGHGVTVAEDLDEYPLRLRQKRQDYFTSCLPWPQKGPDVLLPLADVAPVFGDDNAIWLRTSDQSDGTDNHALVAATDAQTHNCGGSIPFVGQIINPTSPLNSNQALGLATDDQVLYARTHGVSTASSGLYADLSQSVAGTINQLREAWAMQSILETDAMYGTRYPEHLYGHWGVSLQDTAYKPEFLGSGIDFMQFVPVTQTSEDNSNANNYQGKQAGFGVGSGDLGGFTYTSESYGWIMAILSFVPDVSYSQGIDRDWLINDRYDFYLPALANLGEQPVYNVELFCNIPMPADIFGTFGYQEPWAHLRFDFNQLSGLMRPQANVSIGNTSLSQWHFSEAFSAMPTLNTDFLEVDPTIVDRALQVTDQPQFLTDVYFTVNMARVLPAFPSRTRLGGI